MNDLFDPTLCVRFTFYPDRAAEFIEQEGQLVTQAEYDSIDEITDFVREFADAIEEASVLVPSLDAEGKVSARFFNLSDFINQDEEGDDDAN